jgi:membrane protein YqaA with SNARE-associated domain
VSILEGEAPNLPRLLLRFALGLLCLLLFVLALGLLLRPELESFGRSFVSRFGLLGMGFGTLLADGFHVPVPPQFYMLLGISSGVPTSHTLSVIGAGSFIGGWIGFLVARKLLHFESIARFFERPRKLTEATLARYGVWALVLVSMLPIAYSFLCYLAGLSGFRYRAFLLLSVLRLPRLVAYYYLIRLGWSGL